MQSLSQLRADFDEQSKGALSMPIAGLVVWCLVAVGGMVLPP